MKILFDTNIIIDVILERNPFFETSFASLNEVDGFTYSGYILASTITDIYYICKKKLGHIKTIEVINKLVDSINVLSVNKDIIILALHSNFSDFEDAVQSASAELNDVDLIVSRNTQDFANSKTTTLTPIQFLEKYKH